ncbi:MAG: hypothetical protein V8Q30_04120 [Acutalibacteraceae bacterium]
MAELLGLPVEEIDPIWDEMVSFMRLKEKEEELFRAMAEMQQELGGSRTDIRKIPADRQFQRLELPVFIL